MTINDAIDKFNGEIESPINKVELRKGYDIYEE